MSEDISSPEHVVAPAEVDEAAATEVSETDIPTGRRPPDWAAPARRQPLRRLDKVVLLAILTVSVVLHIARLATPGAVLPPTDEECKKFPPIAGARCHRMIPLDEVHYVPDSRDVVRYGTESDTRITGDDGAYVVHPPVGKWFIAAGIALFGDSPFGWRFFGALFGALGTALIYGIALRLWRSPWWAAMAAFLLTVEGLWFVQSRVAMLDIYAAFFVLLGVWALFEDRIHVRERGVRWWRLGAGVAFGLALGSKWSTGPYIAVALGMASAWEVGRARGFGLGAGAPGFGLGAGAPGFGPGEGARRSFTFLTTLTVLPLVIYVASFTPWFIDEHRYNPPICVDKRGVTTQWLCYQREMFNFHRNLEKFKTETDKVSAKEITKPAHPYFGQAWSWPWIGRPVAHAYEVTGEGSAARAHHVLGLPNPAIWWLAFALMPMVVGLTIRRRDQVAAILFAFLVAGWVPYLAADLIDRPVFLFYATPLVPFLVLTVVHAFARLEHRFPRANLVPVIFTVMAAITFSYFYPVLASWPLSTNGPLGWRAHMWLGSDCLSANTIQILCWI